MWDAVSTFPSRLVMHARDNPRYSAAIFALGFVLAALLI